MCLVCKHDQTCYLHFKYLTLLRGVVVKPNVLYFTKLDAGDRFELPMHLAYETGVVTTLPAIIERQD